MVKLKCNEHTGSWSHITEVLTSIKSGYTYRKKAMKNPVAETGKVCEACVASAALSLLVVGK